MHFRGRWDYQLDDRNRVPVPPGYREAFARGVLCQGTEACIELYTELGWKAQAETLERMPLESEEAREAARAFFGSSSDVQTDGQGRISIPGFLLEHAGIEKDVRVLGRNTCLEIWDRAILDGMNDRLKATHRQVLSTIGKLRQQELGSPLS